MNKILKTLGLLLLSAIGASAQSTITGTVLLPSGASGTKAQVCFSLQNYQPNPPRVSGTGTIVGTRDFCVTPAANGTWSTSLYLNSEIEAGGVTGSTRWRVDWKYNGVQTSSALYNITSAGSLNSMTPVYTLPVVSSPSAISVIQSYIHVQGTAATTWTITHSFSDQNVNCVFFDAASSPQQIFPDTVVLTSTSVTTATFTSAQAGRAICVRASSFAILTSNLSSVILSSPTANQQISGPYSLTLDSITAGSFDNVLFVDGVKYARTAAGLQAAINAIDNSGGKGGLVVVPGNDTFSLGTTSITLKNRVRVVGAGTRATNFSYSGTAAAFIGDSVEHCSLENARVYVGTSATAIGLSLLTTTSDVLYCDFQNLEIVGDGATSGQQGIRAVASGGRIVTENTFSNIRLQSLNRPIVKTDIEGNFWYGIVVENWFGASAIGIESTSHAEIMDVRLATAQSGASKTGIAEAGNDNTFRVVADFGATPHRAFNITGTNNTVILQRPLDQTIVGVLAASTTVIDRKASYFPAGSASVPSVSFSQDQDTGLYSVAGNVLTTVDTTPQLAVGANVHRLKSSSVMGWAAGDPSAGGTDTGFSRTAAGKVSLGNGSAADATGTIKSGYYETGTNCSSSASPAVCSSASAGSVVVAAAATTVTVNTTAVTANSQIILTRDNSLGTKLSVTCNTQSSLTLGTPYVSARTAATSFVITLDVAPTTNPMCISYQVIN